MSLMYLIFVGINLAVGLPYWRDWRKVLRINERSSRWFATISLLAVGSFVWALVMLWTLSSWITSLSPSQPKPNFLIIWFIGMVILGILSGVRALPVFQVGEALKTSSRDF